MLVERKQLVENVTDLLTARTGGAAGVLLVGPAGVGTSTVATAVGAAITGRGGLVTTWPELPGGDGGQARDARLVLVVDSPGGLDEAGEAAIARWLTSRHEHRLIVTARRGTGLPPRLIELWSSGVIRRFDVPTLTHLGVEAMATDLLAGPITRGLNDHLVRASGGLPLLVRELVADGCESGAIVLAGTAWAFQGKASGVGPRVLDLVRSRVDTWSAAEREALELVACSGGAPVRMLLQLVDAESLDACERRGFVTESSPGILQVRPPAIERGVRDSMTAARRSVLRQRLGELVAAADDPPGDLLMRAASWALDDGVRPAPALAVAASKAAARTGDFASARRLASAAIGTSSDAEANLALAHALRFSGSPHEARDVLNRLLQPETTAPPDLVEQAVAVRAQIEQYWYDNTAGALAIIDAATPVPGSQHLHVHRLALLAFGGRPEEALEGMERVIEDPASTHLERCVVWPPLITGLALVGRGRDALAHATRAFAVAPLATEQAPYVMTNVTSAWFAARMFGGWGFEELPMIGELAMTGLIQLGLGLPLIRNGRAAEAVVEIDKALAALSIDDPTGFAGLGYAAAATAAVLAGDEERGLRLLDRARSTPLRMSRSVEPEIENLLLWPEFFRGGLDHVAGICRRLVEEYERRGLHACELAIRHTAMRLGAPGLRPADELLDRIDTPAARAMAAQFRGLARRDAELLLDASDQFERFGEVVVAAEAAGQAHHLARSSGQRPLARTAALRVRSLTDGVDISPYPLLHDWSAPEPLTPREREVATLAAQQLSNREIARRLRSSQRTVEAHLHRAYSKLGVADRRELRRRLHDPA